MNKLFAFGERIDGYEIPVLNEREVRASAGILFFLAIVSFMHAWLLGDFRFTRIFVIAFLLDFTIRVFINPKFAPSLILGRFIVRGQVPEYVGAIQKRFAWAIGWILAFCMLFLVIVNRVVGPINLIICLTCLLLLFFEAAFGICIGCKVYNLIFRRQPQLCPGGSCEVRETLPISFGQFGVTVLFFALMLFIGKTLIIDERDVRFLKKDTSQATITNPSEPDGKDCIPPDWAVEMGHAEMWKLHHNCK
jgi:hypothetical protein